jgi:hypothetical protein
MEIERQIATAREERERGEKKIISDNSVKIPSGRSISTMTALHEPSMMGPATSSG